MGRGQTTNIAQKKRTCFFVSIGSLGEKLEAMVYKITKNEKCTKTAKKYYIRIKNGLLNEMNRIAARLRYVSMMCYSTRDLLS